MTWASSDSSVIATDGTVNQPAKGEAAKTVTLTAAVTVRGQTATKEFTVTVNPTTKTAAEQLKEVAAGYVIPSVVRSGDALPAAVNGTTATVTSTKDVAVEDGKITMMATRPRPVPSPSSSPRTVSPASSPLPRPSP